MDPRLQQRVQRYGWDLAASSYESLWQKQIAIAHVNLVEAIRLAAGERVLDVACGTGLVSFVAAEAVGADGRVLGIDLSGEMVESAARRRRSETRPTPRSSGWTRSCSIFPMPASTSRCAHWV
jgi:cyclopropane fatty-acyl-phospholipid synthase-like methyltransferase